MGNFRIVIDCVGGHGQDRSKKDGEIIDFSNGHEDSLTPEMAAKLAILEIKKTGCSIQSAKVYHWPADQIAPAPIDTNGKECITDDLITGIRKGQF